MVIGKLDILALKALSKEKRIELANSIRRDPELYNAVNGIGGLSETASYGLLQGTSYIGQAVADDVKVFVMGKDKIARTVKSNQYGYYKINLAEGPYMVTLERDGKISEMLEAEVLNGVTSTVNYEFEDIIIEPRIVEPVIENVTDPNLTEPIA